jgi:hypothetical protein
MAHARRGSESCSSDSGHGDDGERRAPPAPASAADHAAAAQKDAAWGALLGACVGDAAGGVLEFLGRLPTEREACASAAAAAHTPRRHRTRAPASCRWPCIAEIEIAHPTTPYRPK